MNEFDEIHAATIAGDADTVTQKVSALLAQDVTPQEILDKALIPAMTEVGEQFERGEVFIPEMLVAAHSTKRAMAVLNPILKVGSSKPLGIVVIGTVKGDMHDIGKNLVVALLEGAGFRVVDLGVDVSPEAFLAAVETYQPTYVAISALLTTTMSYMRQTIETVRAAGWGEQVKVMVGGAPVTQNFADEVGADLYAPDAAAASRLAKQAVSIRS